MYSAWVSAAKSVLTFGDKTVLDGDGADFIIWENAFWVGGDENNVFAELAEVSVSQDGKTWTTFPCDPDLEAGFDAGCAGWRPRLEYDTCTTESLRPEEVGGDSFDLATIGVNSAKFIRIRDLSVEGEPPSAGFDLDAVGAVYLSE